MVEKDGIIIKDGQVILNSSEKLSIENLIEEASMKERIKSIESMFCLSFNLFKLRN